MNAYLLVGAGGALGAMARYGVSTVFGGLTRFPAATIGINVLGSILMGLLVGILARTLPPSSTEIRLFAAVGVLGGFTTFSAFSLDAVTLIERGEWGQAALYAVLSVGLSITGLYFGLILTRGGPA